MTGRIIPLNGDRHREVQALLPWYVTATLSEAERVQVEAHLGECADCQAKLRDERRLAAEIAEAPAPIEAPDVEHGWDQISRLIAEPASRRASRRTPVAARITAFLEAARPKSAGAPWLHWAVAAQFCLILVLGAQVWRTPQQPAAYTALGSAPAVAAANVIVVFRPETPEKDLRGILRATNARLVDGPTAADAYLIHVPPAARAAALLRLRKQAQVMLAEPVDSGADR
jgi:predicted anti-sigma-YlaC factor YlaD